ncbi:MAG TPA: hypothetical protein VH593_22455 [Ktedonobacteraceae bacterium]
MKLQHRKAIIKYVGQVLLLLAIILLLVLLGINVTLIASEMHEHAYSPPPPRYIPLPITGLLAWLLWLGPLVVVLLIAAPSLAGRLWAPAETHTTREMQSESEGSAPASARPRRNVGCLRLVLLLLAALAQFLVFTNAYAFDTSGTLYFNDVVMVSHQEAWATGSFIYNVGGDHSVLWHYSTGQWAQVNGPDASGLTVLPGGEVWGVGNAGMLVHERGGNWTQISSGTTDPLNAVAMRSSTDGWAVGGFNHTPIASGPGVSEATVFRSLTLPGSTSTSFTGCSIVHDVTGVWSPVPCPGINILRSVSVLADGSAWAVGDNGTILHEIAGNWASVASPTRSTLRSVVMVSTDEGWAVGISGTILHYMHGNWQLLPQQTTNSLYQVDMISSDEGWIVGDEGTLFHDVHGNWQKTTLPGEPYLASIALLAGDATDGWIVGADTNDQPHIWQKQGADWHPYQLAM